MVGIPTADSALALDSQPAAVLGRRDGRAVAVERQGKRGAKRHDGQRFDVEFGRIGHRVTAVVEPVSPGELTAEALASDVATRLADYKKPRTVVFVDSVRRSTSGKPDLRWAAASAAAAEGPAEPGA